MATTRTIKTDFVLPNEGNNISIQAVSGNVNLTTTLIGGGAKETTALLQANSSTQGVIMPRMSEANRDLIVTPANGLVVYNTTKHRYEYYDGVDLKWKALGGGGVPVQEVPIGAVDNVNTDYEISVLPIDEDAIFVYLNGRLIPKSLWSFTAPIISLNEAPALGSLVYIIYFTDGDPITPVIATGAYQRYSLRLNASQVLAKKVVLSPQPANPSKVIVFYHGVEQEIGVDYDIIADELIFSGYTYDSLLAINDIVSVSYFT